MNSQQAKEKILSMEDTTNVIYSQQQDLSNTTDNRELKYEIHKIDGTPFTVCETPEGYYVTLGRYRLTEKIETLEEAIEDAKREDWERIIAVCHAIIQEDKNFEKNNQ